jgi:hypothetical protein
MAPDTTLSAGRAYLTFLIDKENATAMARTLAAAPRWAPVVGSHWQIRFRRRSASAFRRLLGQFAALPDRAGTAPDDVPAEFFRFPPF